jgi:hypothetical protein
LQLGHRRQIYSADPQKLRSICAPFACLTSIFVLFGVTR